uniref:Ig-like domain-containing protein n=1 Tax=Equus asinus TaxID=9793 RepID=A0A9L0JHF8_EQUAS
MLPLFQALPLTVLGCVYGSGHLEQPRLSSTKELSKTTNLECVLSAVTISTMSISWCQESPGQALLPLLHISSDNTVRMESGIPTGKFVVEIPEPSTSTHTIHNAGKEDSATYYCAFWEVHIGTLMLEPHQSINVQWFFLQYYELEKHSDHFLHAASLDTFMWVTCVELPNSLSPLQNSCK